MNAIECLAVFHEENMAMVKRLLRPVDAAVQPTDEMLEIILTWPREPGEILTPISTPTYDYRLHHAQAAKDAP